MEYIASRGKAGGAQLGRAGMMMAGVVDHISRRLGLAEGCEGLDCTRSLSELAPVKWSIMPWKWAGVPHCPDDTFDLPLQRGLLWNNPRRKGGYWSRSEGSSQS
jgi:hypothetical protein